MIYSFVNLVSWEHFITPAKKEVKRTIFFDSISIKVLVFLVTGKRIRLSSGVDYFFNCVKSSEADCFLVANNSVSFENIFVLPQFYDMSEDELNGVDWSFIKSFKNIYLGISSPKQERLAEFLQTKYNEVDFYCLGAALYVDPQKFRNCNLKFLVFLNDDFQRSIKKIIITLKQIFKVLFRYKVRKNFIEFVRSLDG